MKRCILIVMHLKKVFNYVKDVLRYVRAWFRMKKRHNINEKPFVLNKHKPVYYIIRFDDPYLSGWTVWERVALFGSIYAVDHGMVPVMDMKYQSSIYQEENGLGKVNVWDKYYYQPAGVSVEEAIMSNNYILGDFSQEWFSFIRLRKPGKFTNEYLRKQYRKYIRLRPEIIEICNERLLTILPCNDRNARLIGICIRGTDYKNFQHPVQPDVELMAGIAKRVFDEYKCDFYFIATEDYNIYKSLIKYFPEDKIITYNAGNIKNTDNILIGKQIRSMVSAENAALDYITTLYILNKCNCLVGGVCGATIVAQYRRDPAYEYMEIIDLKRHY